MRIQQQFPPLIALIPFICSATVQPPSFQTNWAMPAMPAALIVNVRIAQERYGEPAAENIELAWCGLHRRASRRQR